MIAKNIFFRKILLIFCLVTLFSTSSVSAQLDRSYFYFRGRQGIIDQNYRDAVNALNILLRVDAKAYEGYFLRGVAKYHMEDFIGAESDFNKAIEQNPVYTMALNYRAMARSRMGNYAQAEEDFSRAIELRPNNAGSYFSRGINYILNHQFDKAVKDYDAFLRLEPREADGYINRGTCYLYLKDTTAAMMDYNRAINVHPYYAVGYMRRGMVNLMKGDDTDAISDMTKAIELDSTLAMAYFYRAAAYSNQGKLGVAVSDYDSAIDLDSMNAVMYFNRAILRSQIGDYNRAIDDYNMVSRANPDNVLVYFNRASVRVMIGDLDEAMSDYSKAIELYPDFANAYTRRSYVLGMLGRPKDARRDALTAEAKIKEYKKNITSDEFAEYVDTSAMFSKLLSFDHQFGNNPLVDVDGGIVSSLRLMPMFRLAVDTSKADQLYGYDPRKYVDDRLEMYIKELSIDGLKLTHDNELHNQRSQLKDSTSSDNNHKGLSNIYSNNKEPLWHGVFAKGVGLMMDHQYRASGEMWNYLAQERNQDEYVLMNKAVVEAEMIQFIASLDGGHSQLVSINIDTGRPGFVQNKGAAQSRNNTKIYDYSGALATMQQAVSINPRFPHLYYNLANIYAMMGNTAQAIENYNKALELFPYFPQCYFNRGVVQILAGELQTGIMDISKAGELGVDQAYDVLKRFRKN